MKYIEPQVYLYAMSIYFISFFIGTAYWIDGIDSRSLPKYLIGNVFQ